MTGTEIYLAVHITLTILNFLNGWIRGEKHRGWATLPAEAAHHIAQLTHLMPRLVEGTHLQFIESLQNYSSEIAQLRAIERIRAEIDGLITDVLYTVTAGQIEISNSQISRLNEILRDPEIDVICPDPGRKELRLDFPFPPYRQTEWGRNKANKLADHWKRTCLSKTAKNALSVRKRDSAWQKIKAGVKRIIEAEAEVYAISLERSSRYRLRYGTLKIEEGAEGYASHRQMIVNAWAELDQLNSQLIPQVGEQKHRASMGATQEWVYQLLALYGEMNHAQQTVQAKADALADTLISYGLASEVLDEFHDRVSLLYSAFSADDMIDRRRHISQALRQGNIPEASDVSAVGFDTPLQRTMSKIAESLSSFISQQYYAWLGKTVESLAAIQEIQQEENPE